MSCYNFFPEYWNVPKLDAAIFADTGGEPEAVYQHLEKLTQEAAIHDIPVYRVSSGNLADHILQKAAAHKPGGIPYYLANNKRGIRHCTRDFKIRPIHRQVRELLGAKPPDFKRVSRAACAELWIGFSEDEILRVSNKYPVQYIKPRFPLIELGYTRAHCEDWLARRG